MEEHGKALADLTAAIAAMTAKIDEIHPVVLEFQGWRPTIEQSVKDLRAEVGDLRAQLWDKGKAADPAAPLRAPPPTGSSQAPSQQQAPLLLRPPPIRLGDLPPIPGQVADEPFQRVEEPLPASGGDGHGPIGHGRTTIHRGMSPGEHTPRAPPVTGMHNFQSLLGEGSFCGERNYHRFPPPPRFDFPLFDGDAPRAWRLKCEAYFRVCTLSPDAWVSCAAMYFIDGALSWLQSTKAHLIYTDWGTFAEAVCVQFGREEF
ncbi:unnamed protein product [Triticum turgidum subsp. durum]|uniref:Uncharacterized protein n=1 Tax=Triticum turgidum subsp. durum TaxID=4567 RepID=A0A9R1NW48_TRITD|nr:unnamed protein product [Triticum turgidum subsp. durum]